MSDHPNVYNPQPNVFSTRSVLLASWFEYAHSLSLRLIRYEPETALFHFWDCDGTAQKIIDGVYGVDPTVNLFRFERTKKRLLNNKLRLDNEYKRQRQQKGAR